MAPKNHTKPGMCSTMIFANIPGGERACINKAIDTFEGKGYCGVHSPVRQQARRKAKVDKNRDQVRVRNLRAELRERYEEIGEAIVDRDEFAVVQGRHSDGDIANNILRCHDIRGQLAKLTDRKEPKS